MADQTIAAFVNEAVHGNEIGIKTLYSNFAKQMFNIALRMTATREDAEDIVQESFIKAFKNLHQLKNPEGFGGWLRQIVIHNCLQLRKRKMNFEALSPEEDERSGENEDWINSVRLDKVHEAIKKLPEGCRQIFLLYASEHYTHKEIVMLLNISESTSKSQYLRAKKLLYTQLKNRVWTS